MPEKDELIHLNEFRKLMRKSREESFRLACEILGLEPRETVPIWMDDYPVTVEDMEDGGTLISLSDKRMDEKFQVWNLPDDKPIGTFFWLENSCSTPRWVPLSGSKGYLMEPDDHITFVLQNSGWVVADELAQLGDWPDELLLSPREPCWPAWKQPHIEEWKRRIGAAKSDA